VCSDPFPGQGFQTTTPTQNNPVRTLKYRPGPTRDGRSQSKDEPASGWRRLSAGYNHWHRHSGSNSSTPHPGVTRSRPSTICEEASDIYEKARRGPIRETLEPNHPIAGSARRSVDQTKHQKSQNRPLALTISEAA